jgi:hypothetical protein
MVRVGFAVWALDEYGPRSRVVFFPYLPPFGEIAYILAGAAVGLSLCIDAAARLGRDAAPYRPLRLAVGCSLGGLVGIVLGTIAAGIARGRGGASEGLATAIALAAETLCAFGGAFASFKRSEGAPRTSARSIAARSIVACAFLAWAAVRQLDAFPSHGDIAERDAWARAHVREYPGLVRFASQLPVVTSDLGKVVAVAPTGAERHSHAWDMDGDAMRFTLDMVGETTRGTLWVDATFTQGNLWEWRAGRWTYNAVTTPVEVRTGTNNSRAR